jgi:hypothetical protein
MRAQIAFGSTRPMLAALDSRRETRVLTNAPWSTAGAVSDRVDSARANGIAICSSLPLQPARRDDSVEGGPERPAEEA